MNKAIPIAFSALAFIIVIAPAATAQFDYSRPFPLSLLEYENMGGELAPWPLDVANIQINTDGTTQLQNEEMVAINPQNPANAVALWRDFRLGYRRVGVGYTFDGGQTWHDTLLVVPPYPWQSDPVLTVDTSGNFFACTLCLQSTGQGPTGIYIQKSTDGGVSWSPPVIAIDSASAYFEDKQMITLDKSAGPNYGNIYIAWARFTADLSTSMIYSLSSTNGGQSYEAPVRVSEGTGVQWPVPALSPNGDLFVTWFRYVPRGIYMDRSTDAGQTFGADLRVTTTTATSTTINGNILVFPFPAFMIDSSPLSPFITNMYIAYMDFSGTDMDIFFIRSTNNGLDWSNRIRINDDDDGNGADQFHPWLSIDDMGVIHAVFYDRRLDVPDNLLFDLFYTHSEDGGLTWSPNERITSVSSNPNQASLAGLIGEYIGLSAWQGQVQMVWTDTRNGNQDVFSGRIDITGIDNEAPSLPQAMHLGNPYPNPFNGSVSVEFYSSSERKATLEVLDMLGRRVAVLHDGLCRAGATRVVWDGRAVSGMDVSSGPYFLRLKGEGASDMKKAVLLR